MRRALVASVVALLAAVPAASADPPPPPPIVSSPYGACNFNSLSQRSVTGPGTYVGLAHGYAVLWDETSPTTPVGATIRCDITVNGVVAASTPEEHGTGVVATAGTISFTAGDGDWIDICMHVVMDDGRVFDCYVPPCRYMFNIEYMSCWNELLDWAFDVVEPAYQVVDPVVCAALDAAAPGYGPVRIEPGGDVYLAGELWYDCPPYAW